VGLDKRMLAPHEAAGMHAARVDSSSAASDLLVCSGIDPSTQQISHGMLDLPSVAGMQPWHGAHARSPPTPPASAVSVCRL
jgi:hypothetical protein